MKRELRYRNSRGGFSLVEVTVVVVILGVLAAFGVPRMLKSVERSKAAEAFAYLAAVRSSQENYQSRQGTYACRPDRSGRDVFDAQVLYRRHLYRRRRYLVADADAGWGLVRLWRLHGDLHRRTATTAANSTIEDLPEINPRGT